MPATIPGLPSRMIEPQKFPRAPAASSTGQRRTGVLSRKATQTALASQIGGSRCQGAASLTLIQTSANTSSIRTSAWVVRPDRIRLELMRLSRLLRRGSRRYPPKSGGG